MRGVRMRAPHRAVRPARPARARPRARGARGETRIVYVARTRASRGTAHRRQPLPHAPGTGSGLDPRTGGPAHRRRTSRGGLGRERKQTRTRGRTGRLHTQC